MTDKTFEFTVNGDKFSIPAFADLPMGVLRKSRHATDEMDKVFTIVEDIMGTDSAELAAIDSMNATEFASFLAEWTGGAPVGESSGSGS